MCHCSKVADRLTYNCFRVEYGLSSGSVRTRLQTSIAMSGERDVTM